MQNWFSRLVPFRRVPTPSDGLSVCFLGDGISGSWQMRGEQIAGARAGWTALPTKKLRAVDIDRYDLFCIVKRFDRDVAQRLRSLGKKVVYDVVDPWKQPDAGQRHATLSGVISFFTGVLRDIPADGVIFPNRVMAQDLGHLVSHPITIYHHHKPDLVPIRVRRTAQAVGYEGVPGYLGPWQAAITEACARHGLEFIVNPPSLAQLDIGFAARGGPHGTLMALRYKSNVKLANFFAAGIPCMVHDAENSYHETDNGSVRFFRNESEVNAVLESLLPFQVRLDIHRAFLAHRADFSLERIVGQYESYFNGLVSDHGEHRAVARAAG